MGRWLLFDDENIQQIDESDISKYYGDTPGTGSGYVLFYQAADIVSPQPKTPPAHQPTFAQQFEATDGGEDAVESLEPDIVTPLAESSLEDRPNITKSHSTADSPTKEKKSFFGLSARKTSSRPRTAPEATTPSSQGGNSSEIASVSSSVDASDASSSSAMLVAPPQMHLDLSGPRVPLDANLTPPAPLSPPQSSDRRSSFGRFFSRSKSFRQHEPGPSTSPSKATAEPCITATSSQTQSSSSDMPSLSYEPSPPSAASPPKLDKKRIKERIKREKEEAKAKQKAEKDEAKRLKSELKRSKSIAIPSNQSDKS